MNNSTIELRGDSHITVTENGESSIVIDSNAASGFYISDGNSLPAGSTITITDAADSVPITGTTVTIPEGAFWDAGSISVPLQPNGDGTFSSPTIPENGYLRVNNDPEPYQFVPNNADFDFVGYSSYGQKDRKEKERAALLEASLLSTIATLKQIKSKIKDEETQTLILNEIIKLEEMLDDTPDD